MICYLKKNDACGRNIFFSKSKNSNLGSQRFSLDSKKGETSMTLEMDTFFMPIPIIQAYPYYQHLPYAHMLYIHIIQYMNLCSMQNAKWIKRRNNVLCAYRIMRNQIILLSKFIIFASDRSQEFSKNQTRLLNYKLWQDNSSNKYSLRIKVLCYIFHESPLILYNRYRIINVAFYLLF